MTSDGGDDPSKKPVDPTIQKQSVELTPEELVLLKKIRAMELAGREPTDIKDPKRAGYPLGREMAHSTGICDLPVKDQRTVRSEMTILDIIKLPICLKKPRGGPSRETPYHYFKSKVQQQVSIYGLRGTEKMQYIMRCMEEPALADVQELVLNDYYDHEIWAELDRRYDEGFKKYGMHSRWAELAQNDGESASAFARRLEQEALLMKSSVGRIISREEMSTKYRNSLRPKLRKRLHKYIGPKYKDFDKLREIADYFEEFESKQHSGSLSKTQPSSRNAGAKSNQGKRCKFFGTERGCRLGDKCDFKHEKTPQNNGQDGQQAAGKSTSVAKPGGPPANSGVCYQFYNTGTCNREKCLFRHERPDNAQTRSSVNVVMDDDCYALQNTESKVRSLTTLDTGCTAELMELSAAEAIGLQVKELATHRGVRLADGSTRLEVVGTAAARVNTKRTSAVIEFKIMRKLCVPVILGITGMSALGITIDMREGQVPKVSSGHYAERVDDELPFDDTVCYEYSPEEQSLGPSDSDQDSADDNTEFACGVSLMFDNDPQQAGNRVHQEPDVEGGEPNNDRLLEIWEEEGQYCIELPWSGTSRPNRNGQHAQARADYLERKLSPAELTAVQDEVNSLVLSGILREVDPSEIRHYIPPRPVFRKDSTTTSTRLAIDSRLINYHLEKLSIGEQHKLLEVLTAWRGSPHYTSLDLKKAFNSVGIGMRSQPWLGLRLFGRSYVWAFLPFGLICSPAILLRALKDPMEVLCLALPCTPLCYVDDIGLRANTIDELHEAERRATGELEKKGFRTQPKKRISTDGSCDGVVKKHLGYLWDVAADEIRQLPPSLPDLDQWSKRQVISAYAKFFDVMGLFLEVGISARSNASLVHEDHRDWKDIVGGIHVRALKDWHDAITTLAPAVPRAVGSARVVIFCDASGLAWAAEAYCVRLGGADDLNPADRLYRWRAVGGIFPRDCKWSTPKRELFALRQATRLGEELIGCAKVHGRPLVTKPDITYLSDAEINIFRLRRIGKSRSGTDAVDVSRLEKKWLSEISMHCNQYGCDVIHVRTKDNLADAASRGCLDSSTTLGMSDVDRLRHASTLTRFEPSGQQTLVSKEDEPEAVPRAVEDLSQYESADEFVCELFAIFDEEEISSEVSSVGTLQEAEPLDWNEILRDHQRASPFLRNLRSFVETGKLEEKCPISLRAFKNDREMYMIEDDLLKRRIRSDGKGAFVPQVMIDHSDDKMVNLVIDKYHDKSGHMSASKLEGIIREEFFWRRMSVNIRRRLRSCDCCQRVAAQSKWRKNVSALKLKGNAPCQIWGIDHVCGLPEGQVRGRGEGGYRNILTITCATTGFTWLRACRSTGGEEVRAILSDLVGDVGRPLLLISDRHQAFRSKSLTQWAMSNSIKLAMLPARGGPYSGWFERGHGKLRDFIAKRNADDPESMQFWPTWLSEVQLVINCTPFSNSELSPADLMYAYKVSTPWEMRNGAECGLMDGR